MYLTNEVLRPQGRNLFHLQQPIDFFMLFFSNEIVKMLQQQTNFNKRTKQNPPFCHGMKYRMRKF
jgi:hypothetical protein